MIKKLTLLLCVLTPTLVFAETKKNGSDLSANVNLSDWKNLDRATTLLDRHQNTEALSSLRKINNNSLWKFWKQSLMAKALVELKRYSEVETILADLPLAPDLSINPDQDFYKNLYGQTLLDLRTALTQQKKSTTILDEKIWANFPDQYNQLQTGPVQFTPQVTSKIRRMRVLIQNSQAQEGVSLVTSNDLAQAALDLNEKCDALFEWAMAQKSVKNNDAALDGFSEFIKHNCEGTNLVRALYWQGKILWQSRRLDEAANAYKTLIQKFPDNRLTDDAYYGLVKIYTELQQPQLAKTAQEKLDALPSGDMHDEDLWETTWNAIQRNNFEQALLLLDKRLAQNSGVGESYPRALYWKARVLEKLNRHSEIKQLQHRLSEEFPYSYYTLMAFQQGGNEPKINLNPPADPNPLSNELMELKAIVEDLAKNHQTKKAANVMDYATHLLPPPLPSPLIAKLWIEAEVPHRALRMAYDQMGIGPSLDTRESNSEMSFALFPKAYPSATSVAYHLTNLPKGTLEGIMREESLFKTKVRSSVGAAGLMQLMPRTASATSRLHGFGNVGIQELENPDINIKLGGLFFKNLFDTYDGNLALAIMGYNAGPGNVNKWLRGNANTSLDVFIENCPFDETRGYVKRVLRSAWIYGEIADEKFYKKSFLPLKIPESRLTNAPVPSKKGHGHNGKNGQKSTPTTKKPVHKNGVKRK